MEFLKRLDFQLAWKRIKNDLRYSSFLDHPYEVDLIQSDIENWIESLKNKIENGLYNPSRSKIIDIPKPNWHIRPASLLTIEDSVIYSAILLDNIEKIKRGIEWSSNSRRFSQIMKDNHPHLYCGSEITNPNQSS